MDTNMNLVPLNQPATGGGPDHPATSEDSKLFRRLKFNELVSVGDFVAGKDNQFEPWDGPRGFQAGSFVKPIYRRNGRQPRATKRPKYNN
jgi:hypothetical protein